MLFKKNQLIGVDDMNNEFESDSLHDALRTLDANLSRSMFGIESLAWNGFNLSANRVNSDWVKFEPVARQLSDGSFSRRASSEDYEDTVNLDYFFKLHVKLFYENYQDFCLSVSQLSVLLHELDVHSFKIISEKWSEILRNNKCQQGKSVTIYLGDVTAEKILDLVERIECFICERKIPLESKRVLGDNNRKLEFLHPNYDAVTIAPGRKWDRSIESYCNKIFVALTEAGWGLGCLPCPIMHEPLMYGLDSWTVFSENDVKDNSSSASMAAQGWSKYPLTMQVLHQAAPLTLNPEVIVKCNEPRVPWRFYAGPSDAIKRRCADAAEENPHGGVDQSMPRKVQY